MNKRILALAVGISLLTCSANLIAKEGRGAKVIVYKLDGQQTKGELIAVKRNSLLLLESSTQSDISIEIDNMQRIKVIGSSKTIKILSGTAIGIVVGGGTGALIAIKCTDSEHAPGNGLLGAAIGAIPGLFVGWLWGSDSAFQIEGKSPQEISVVMEKLRSKARITDFQ